MNRFKALVALLALSTTAGTALAGSVIVPNTNVTVAQPNGGSGVFFLATSRYQQVISGSQLAAIPNGTPITGFALRRCAFSGCDFAPSILLPWPPANATIATYRIQVSTSLNPPGATFSTTFANNINAVDRINAYGGATGAPYTMPAGAFASGGGFTLPIPRPWGPCINFTTPFTWNGGNLLIDETSTGHGSVNQFFDSYGAVVPPAATSSPFMHANLGQPNTALVGAVTSAVIMKIYFSPSTPGADLTVTKTLSPGQKPKVTPGESGSFDVTVHNNSAFPLLDGHVNDFMDGCFNALASCAANIQCFGGVSCGSCAVAGAGFTVSGFQLGPNGSATDTIVFRVKATPNTTGVCGNSAQARDGDACPSVFPTPQRATLQVVSTSSQESVDAIEAKIDAGGGTDDIKVLLCNIIRLLHTPDGQRNTTDPVVAGTCGTTYTWNGLSSCGPRPLPPVGGPQCK